MPPSNIPSSLPPHTSDIGGTSAPKKAPKGSARLDRDNVNGSQQRRKNKTASIGSHGITGGAAGRVSKAQPPPRHKNGRANPPPTGGSHLAPPSRPAKRSLPDTAHSASRKRVKFDPQTSSTPSAQVNHRRHRRLRALLERPLPPFFAPDKHKSTCSMAYDDYLLRTSGIGSVRLNDGELRAIGYDCTSKGYKLGGSVVASSGRSGAMKTDRGKLAPMKNGGTPGNTNRKVNPQQHLKPKKDPGTREKEGQKGVGSGTKKLDCEALRAAVYSSIFFASRSTKAALKPDLLVHGRSRPAKAIKPACAPVQTSTFPFFRLPRELRDKIYRHLLQASKPITVFKAWTRCYGRHRGGLDPTILRVNKQAAEEGIEILYSTNIFSYLLRDRGRPVTAATDPAGVFCGWATRGIIYSIIHSPRFPPRVIYLTKYARFIRRLELIIEGNRSDSIYGKAMARALVALRVSGVRPLELFISFAVRDELIKDGPRTYYSMTMVGFFGNGRIGRSVMSALRALQFGKLRIRVMTLTGDRLETVLDGPAIRAGFRSRHETDIQGASRIYDPWLKDPVVQDMRARRAAESLTAFKNLRFRIEEGYGDIGLAVQRGWWRQICDMDDCGKCPDCEKDGKVAKGSQRPQGVDASQVRPGKFEEKYKLVAGARRRRIWCAIRVKGKLVSYMA